MKEVVASKSRLPVRDRLQPKCDLFSSRVGWCAVYLLAGWIIYI
jgi:hypothetical protein